MQTVMLQFKHQGPAPLIDEVSRLFNLQVNEIDTQFGVIPTDPAEGIYTVLVAAKASERVKAVLLLVHATLPKASSQILGLSHSARLRNRPGLTLQSKGQANDVICFGWSRNRYCEAETLLSYLATFICISPHFSLFSVPF